LSPFPWGFIKGRGNNRERGWRPSTQATSFGAEGDKTYGLIERCREGGRVGKDIYTGGGEDRMNVNYYIGIGVFLMATAVTVFALALYINIIEVKIALIVAAIGLFASGLIQLGRVGERQKEEERQKELLDKLNEIHQEVNAFKESKQGGVAIADVISSGLKYYAEHMAEPKKEDEND
jgi:hypothetical protein